MQSTLLRTLFQTLEKTEYVALRAIQGKGPTAKVLADYVKSVEKAEAFVEKWRTSADVYFGVCARNAAKPADEFVSRAFAVWADVDGQGSDKKGLLTTPKEEVLKQALDQLILEPSIIVDSGNGYHLYWLLQEPTSEVKVVKIVNLQVQALIGSGAVSDPTRILRVDNTFNHKSEPPKSVVIHTDNTGARYTLQDLGAMCRLTNSKIIKKIQTGNSQGFKSKSERDYAVIAALVKCGFTDECIRFIFETMPVGDKFREAPPNGGEKYFERTLKSVHEKLAAEEADSVDDEEGKGGGKNKGEKPEESVTIFEKNDCYYMHTERGPKQLSTFIFLPEMLLHGESDQDPDVLLGTIRASGYEWPNIPLSRKAFVRTDSLIKELPLAAWQWIGPDSIVRYLLPYLMDKLRAQGLPKRTATHEVGYHKGGYWIGTTQTLTKEGKILAQDASVVAMPSKGERPKVTYSEEEPSKELVQEFFNLVGKINTPEVVWPVLAWAAACPYKTRLQEQNIRFPVLNLYGTRGSGKTTIITRVVQPLMGYDEPRTYDCSTTKFVMLSLLGSCNGIPVAFSEYRSSMKSAADKMLRYLLLSYDVGHDPRGRSDQTVQDYPLLAPFSVDGNDALSDEAVLERVIQINMHPESIEEGTEAFEAFQDLATLDLKKIGTSYIINTLKRVPKWDVAVALCKQAFPQKMPDRVRRNITCCVVGLLSLETYAKYMGCQMPKVDAAFVSDVMSACVESVVNATTGRGTIITDIFVTDLINEFAMRNGATPYFISKYDDEANIFWFQLSTALTWWLINRRKTDRMVMDTAAIKAQLRERMATNIEERKGGQYVVGREAKTIDGRTYWVYGVSLEAATFADLDVPQSLCIPKIRIVPKKTREEAV
jgi:hypothetical protein